MEGSDGEGGSSSVCHHPGLHSVSWACIFPCVRRGAISQGLFQVCLPGFCSLRLWLQEAEAVLRRGPWGAVLERVRVVLVGCRLGSRAALRGEYPSCDGPGSGWTGRQACQGCWGGAALCPALPGSALQGPGTADQAGWDCCPELVLRASPCTALGGGWSCGHHRQRSSRWRLEKWGLSGREERGFGPAGAVACVLLGPRGWLLSWWVSSLSPSPRVPGKPGPVPA